MLSRLPREILGQGDVPIDGANRDYSVRELLEGVRDDESRRQRGRSAVGGRDSRLAQRIDSPYKGKIDFGILTIRQDENDAVLRRFPKLACEDRQRRYRIRTPDLPGGGAYTLAVVRCLEQGNTDAQAAARDLLEDLRPRFLLVIGIAGGVPAHEFTLGDVVVSNRIVDFSVEALIKDQATEYSLGGGPLHPDAAKLAADVSAMVTDGDLGAWNSRAAITLDRPPIDLAEDRFYGETEWKDSVRDKVTRHFKDRPSRPPLVTTGAVASSDRLIKEDEKLAVWLKVARQIIAVEMESAGIYKAAHGKVPFLAIRGISDVPGYTRHPDWTAYACETAAAFALAFLLNRPVAPIGQIDAAGESHVVHPLGPHHWRKQNNPRLFDTTISRRPSPSTSTTTNWVPTPESSSIRCGTNVVSPSRTCSNQ
jgi:nucleoside phosphorylase